MSDVKTYSANGKLYAIPKDKQDAFLKDMPDATPVYAFDNNGKKLGIPQDKVKDFLADMPQAKPLYEYPDLDSLLNIDRTKNEVVPQTNIQLDTAKQDFRVNPRSAMGMSLEQAKEVATSVADTRQEEREKGFWNTWLGDAIEAVGEGSMEQAGGILKFSEIPARMFFNTVAKRNGMEPEVRKAFADVMVENMPTSTDEVRKDLDKVKEKLAEKSDRYEGKDFIELWKEGDRTGAIGEIFLEASKSIPISLFAMLGGAPGMAAIGLTTAGNKFEQLDQPEKPDEGASQEAWDDYLRKANMGEFAKLTNAILSGTAEAGAEYLGSIPLLKYIGKIGKKGVTEGVRKGFTETASKFFQKYGLLTEPLVEGMEEFFTTVAENTVDWATGARPDLDPLEDTFKSFVYGVGGGAQFTGGVAAVQGANYLKNKLTSSPEQPQQPGQPTDSPQAPTINPRDTYIADQTKRFEDFRHESGNLVTINTTQGPFTVAVGDIENGKFVEPDGIIFVHGPDGNNIPIQVSDIIGDLVVKTQDEFLNDQISRFDTEEQRRKLASEAAFEIDGQRLVDSGQTDEQGNMIAVPLDENGNPQEAGAIPLTPEQVEQAQQQKQTINQTVEQGQPQPEIKKATWGKNEYQYTKNEDGTSNVLIPNKIKPEAALKEIQKHFENNQKFEAVPVTETREVPAPDDFSDPTTEDVMTGIKIVPKQIATPVTSGDNKKTAKAEPKYQIGKETVDQETAAELINLAIQENDISIIEGLKVDNDPQLQDMILQAFPEKTPMYQANGQNISKPQAKARILAGKLDGLTINNDAELQTLFDKKAKELKKSVPTKSTADDRAINSEIVSNISKGLPVGTQPFSDLDVETKMGVQSFMLSMSNDLEVRKAVIGLIPIDVMNDITGLNLSAEEFLNNESVFRDLLSVDINDPVLGRFIDNLSLATTGFGAEVDNINSGRRTTKENAAKVTDNLLTGDKGSVVAGVGTEVGSLDSGVLLNETFSTGVASNQSVASHGDNVLNKETENIQSSERKLTEDINTLPDNQQKDETAPEQELQKKVTDTKEPIQEQVAEEQPQLAPLEQKIAEVVEKEAAKPVEESEKNTVFDQPEKAFRERLSGISDKHGVILKPGQQLYTYKTGLSTSKIGNESIPKIEVYANEIKTDKVTKEEINPLIGEIEYIGGKYQGYSYFAKDSKLINDILNDLNEGIKPQEAKAPETVTPDFKTYKEAQEWIEEKSKSYKSKNEFYSSPEYIAAYPAIKELQKQEKEKPVNVKIVQSETLGEGYFIELAKNRYVGNIGADGLGTGSGVARFKDYAQAEEYAKKKGYQIETKVDTSEERLTPNVDTSEKQPWEMTREEFIQSKITGLKGYALNDAVTNAGQQHKEAIEQAIIANEFIPDNVLEQVKKEYPELFGEKKADEVTPLENKVNEVVEGRKEEPGKQYGAANKIVTNDRYEELKKRMRDKLNNLNAGFDPELLAMGAEMAAYHVEAGARKFGDFAKRMVNDLGDGIKPYLKAIYNAARDLPGMETLESQMDEYSAVKSADIDAVIEQQSKVEEAPEVQETVEQRTYSLTEPVEQKEDTRDGSPFHLVKMTTKLDDWTGLKKIAKDNGGGYSLFAKGFIFRNGQEAAEKFKNDVENKYSNDEYKEPRSTAAIESEVKAIENEVETITDSKQAAEALERIDDLISDVEANLKLKQEAYSTDGINHEYPNLEVAKRIKKDVTKFSKTLAKALGWEHDADKRGKVDYAHANIAPAGGDATFILWKPGTDYGVYVSIPYQPDYKTGYDDYSINGIMSGSTPILWRITTKKDKYRGLGNQYAKGDISVGELRTLVEKAIKPYVQPKAETPKFVDEVVEQIATQKKQNQQDNVKSNKQESDERNDNIDQVRQDAERTPERPVSQEVQDDGQGRDTGSVLPEQGGISDQVAPSPDGQGVERDGSRGSSDRTTTGNDGRLNKNNYSIPQTYEAPASFSASQNLENNIAALETLIELEQKKRPATAKEKEILFKFVGFGGLSNILLEPYQYNWRGISQTEARRLERVRELVAQLDPDGKIGVLEAIKRSTHNAHYTSIPVIQGIYKVIEKAGFTKGNVLEPSMGNGHFFGAMPNKMTQNSKLFGVELDYLTGKIAKALYPDANIQITGLQDAALSNNYFDLIVSNIPFGDIKVYDPAWKNSSKPIYKIAQNRVHNYFAVKQLELVKPGGMIAFITSNGMLDAKGNESIRKHISESAEFLGAIRLPNTAFKGNANTEVTTDIVFLRKFKEGEQPVQNHEFMNTLAKTVKDKDGYGESEVFFNEYFHNNPNMMLGTPMAGGLYRQEEFTLQGEKDLNWVKEISSRGNKIIPKDRKAIDTTVSKEETNQRLVKEYKGIDNDYLRHGNIALLEGKIGRISISKTEYETTKNFEEVKINAPKAQVIDFIRLRNTLSELMVNELEGESDKVLTPLRTKLNGEYDRYTKKHGRLRDKSNAFISEDIDQFTIKALERYDQKGKYVGKADIFTKRTINPIANVTSVETPEQAILVSLDEYGAINAKRMEELLGKDWEEQLYEQVFELPDSEGNYQTRDQYLSGNVRHKLDLARKAAVTSKKYDHHVKALESVMPTDISPANIKIQFGARWVPAEYYSQFIKETFAQGSYWDGGTVYYVEGADKFVVESLQNTPEARLWGTNRKSAQDVLDAAINDSTISVYDSLEDGKKVYNSAESQAANDKVSRLRKEWEKWQFKDGKRMETLSRLYNDKFNSTIKRKYDGSHLTFPGLQGVTLRPHQKDAAWMIMQNNGGVIDHAVGAGKTLVMITAAMEMRRTGVAKKPLMVALKSTVPQIADKFREHYPFAKVLAPMDNQFSAKNRKNILAQIATNDWDCVILSHDQYKMLDHKPEIVEGVFREELEMIDASLEFFYGVDSPTQMTKRQIKGLQKRKDNLMAKMRELSDRRVDEFAFENLGIDHLFIDESHTFKNLAFTTSHTNIAGLGDPSGNQGTMAMLMGVRALQRMHQGDKGTTFLSGTPISNSMVELYLILRYLRPNKLSDLGMHTFDSWASVFAERSSEVEFSVTGQLKEKNRFRNYTNVPELAMLYAEIADVRNDKNLVLPKPEAKYELVNIKPSDIQRDLVNQIIEFAKSGDGSSLGITGDPERIRKSKMLLATGLSAKVAIDPRLHDGSLPDAETSKINIAATKLNDIYLKTKDDKGVQLVFSDMGVPSDKFNVYDELKSKLVDLYEIPDSEVQFIHDYNTDTAKDELFKKVNAGEVRILIGSTGKMGTGVNVQERIVAMHHLDVPWTPAAFEQRNGRGVRQGNMVAEKYGNKVDIFVYALEQSLDAYKYQLLDIKQKFIDAIKDGSMSERHIDEGAGEDGGMSFAEFVSVLSGNPIILEKAKNDKLINRLSTAQRNFQEEQWSIKRKYQEAVESNEKMTVLVDKNNQDIDYIISKGFVQDKDGKYLPQIKIGSKTFDKFKEAGEYLLDKGILKPNATATVEGYGVKGIITNHEALRIGDESILKIRLEGQPSNILYQRSATIKDPVRLGMALNELLKDVINNAGIYQRKIQDNNEIIEKFKPLLNQEWDRQAELDQALAEYTRINAELAAIDQQQTASESQNDVAMYIHSNLDIIQNAKDEIGTAKTPEEKFRIIADIVSDIHSLTGRITPISVMANKDQAEGILRRNNVPESTVKDIVSYLKDIGYKIPGFYIRGRIYIITDNVTSSEELIETWLHETAHMVIAQSFKKPDMQKLYDDLGVDYIDSVISKYEAGNNPFMKANEAIAYTVGNLLKKHSLENVLTGNVDIEHLPLPLQNAVNKVIDRFKDYYGNIDNQIEVRGQDAHQGNQRGSGEIRQDQKGKPGDGRQGSIEPGQQTPLERRLAEIARKKAEPIKPKSPFLEERLSSGDYMPDKLTINGAERHTRNSNGNLIHPTRRGIENFYKWFGESKVVDAEGRPLVVYHGTDGKFNAFTPNFAPGWGTGIYLTDNMGSTKEFGDNTMSQYVRLSNPITPSNLYSTENAVIGTKAWQDFQNKERKRLNDDEYELDFGDVEQENIEVLNKAWRELGYDGIIGQQSNNIQGKEYVVFSPNQIKSATGNDGGFNPDDNRVLFRKTPVEDIAESAGQVYKDKVNAKRTWNEIANGMREFYKDMELPIRRLQEQIKELGGKITDKSNPYRDITLAKGRMEALYRDFTDTKMKPVLQTVTKIMKSGINGDNILPYLISKHALERNPDLRAKEIQDEIKKFTFRNQNMDDAEFKKALEKFDEALKGKLKDKDYSGVMEFQRLHVARGGQEYKNPEELARAIVDGFESKVNEAMITELWDNMKIASTATLDIWKASNAMTEAEYNQQLSRYKNFVPLRGWREAAEKELAYLRGIGSGHKSLVHAQGRRSMAENPLAVMQNVAFKALGEQVDNEVNQSMLQLVANNYNKPEFKQMYELKTAYYVKGILEDGTEGWVLSRDEDGNIVKPDQDMFESGDAKIKPFHEHERRRTIRQAGEHEVLVKGSNMDHVIVFKNKTLNVAQAMKHQNVMYRSMFTGEYENIDNWDRPLSMTLGRANNLLKGMYTSYNIVFPLTNFARDANEAALSQWIKGESGVAVVKNYKKAFPAIVRDIFGKSNNSDLDKKLKRFYEVGGATGYTHLKTPQQIEKELNQQLDDMLNRRKLKGALGRNVRGTIHSIEMWNRVFEDATRFSVFLSALEAGHTEKDAASQAKEASVNFNRKGKSSKSFDSWWAFWNVAWEAMFKNFGLMKKAPARFATVAGGFAAAGFIMAVLNDMMDDDDDKDKDYYNISEFARYNYLLIPDIYSKIVKGQAGDKYFRIPLPQFWRGFYASGSILYDVMQGKVDPIQATGKSLIYFAEGLSPVDIPGLYVDGKFSYAPLVPTVFRPVQEVRENRDFLGQRIYKEPFTKEQEEMLAQSGLSRNNVNVAAKFFTDMAFKIGGGEPDTGLKGRIVNGEFKKVPGILDINPSKVEHIFKGYTGGTGGVVSDAINTVAQFARPDEDVDFRNLPFVNAFIRKIPEGKWATIREFYDLKDKYSDYEKVMNEYKKIAFKGGDTKRYIDSATNTHAREYITTMNYYDSILGKMMKTVDMKDADNSKDVLDLMEKAINDIEKLNKRYNK